MTNRFIAASKAVLRTNQDTIKQVVETGRVLALRGLDARRRLMREGAKLVARTPNYGLQLETRIARIDRAVDVNARKLVATGAEQARKAVDQVAALVDKQVVIRLEHAVQRRAKVARRLDQFAPAAEAVRDVAQRVHTATARVYEFAQPKMARVRVTKAKVQRVARRGTKAVRRKLRAAA